MSQGKRLSLYIKKHPLYCLVSLVSALLFSVAITSIPLLTGKIVDVVKDMVVANSFGAYEKIFLNYLSLLSLLIAIVLIFEFVFELTIGLFVENLTKDIKDDLFSKIQTLSIESIDKKRHGELLNRLIVDTENVNNGMLSAFKQLYQGSIQIIVTIIIMFFINWILGLTVVLLTPFNFAIAYIFTKKSKKSVRATTKKQGDLTSLVVENINNIELIKSFNFEEQSFNDYMDENQNLYVVGQKSQFITSMTNPLTRLMNYLTYSIVGLLAAILCVLSYENQNVLLGANCTIGTILMFVQYSTQFAKPFNEISASINEIQIARSSFNRINEVLNEDDDLDLGIIKEVESLDISFKNVDFGYNESTKVIKNFNFELYKGRKVAIVGPTGCGKTTLINLILRFYDPQNGSINIGKVDTKDLTKNCLRDNIGLVLQDTWIFSGTVLENIKYAKPNATMDEVVEACKKANAYNFIKHLPKSFDTQISDKVGLSVGEKQLICIARVFLRNPDILILDEATSNIDTRSELKIAKALNELMINKTSIIIAHRLSTIKNCDVILAMKDGEIIEIGNHKELIEQKGFYYRLYNAQYSN